MSETKKLLVGFGAIVLVCLCTLGLVVFSANRLGQAIVGSARTAPTALAKAHEKIADFTMPSGYQPLALSFIGYDMVELIRTDSTRGMVILMMQYSGSLGGSPAEVEARLRKQAQQQNNNPAAAMHIVAVHERVVRGKSTTVTIREGDANGVTIRQWSTVFEGKGGPTILMITGPVFNWNDQLLDDFVTSIQ